MAPSAGESSSDHTSRDEEADLPPYIDELLPLGERIRALRLEQDLSISELSRLAGVSKGYLSQVERSPGARPSAATLYAVARALGASVADLFQVVDREELETGVSESLREFAEQDAIPPSDVEMLSQIRYRGMAPHSVDDWRYLYESIRRSVGFRP